mgnify:CR=1 FL=1
MTPEVQEALDFLKTITPTTIQLKTDATMSQRMDFESIWLHHGPQAARYSLLARYMNGTISAV